jgi:hypothetical protein
VGEAFNLHENVVKKSKIFEVRSFIDVLIAKQFEGLQADLPLVMLTRPVAFEPQV